MIVAATYTLALLHFNYWYNLPILTADIGAEYGDVRPLDKARMCKLSANRVQLLDLIDASDAFVTELASSDVITWRQRERIVEMIHRRDRTEILLDLIARRSVADFHKFIEVLSREQHHLVPLLVTDGGEIYSWCSYGMLNVPSKRHVANYYLLTTVSWYTE